MAWTQLRGRRACGLIVTLPTSARHYACMLKTNLASAFAA